MTALLLLGPALPMLFQGQEFGSSRPFVYFADHDESLADAVHAGRLDFLSQFPGLTNPDMRDRLPQPNDRSMFDRCQLSDEEREADTPLARLHGDLLRIRRTDPVLGALGTSAVVIESSAPTLSVVVIRYFANAGHRVLIVNLADDHLSPMNEPLFAPRPGSAWQLRWDSEDPAYGGSGIVPFVGAGRWLIRGRSAMLLASATKAERSG
jgi:maltooligosyltrehalose trehalohydrolase